MAAELLLLNPRRRRRRKANPKRSRRARRRNPYPLLGANPRRRRRSRRSNPYPLLGANPRRRRRRSNPSRRSRRRNPSVRGMFAGITTLVTTAAKQAVGATAVDLAMGQIAPRLPATLLTPNVYPVVKAGAAVGLGMIVSKFLPGDFGRKMAEGSLTVTLYSVIRGFMPATVPLGYINPGYVPRQGVRGMGEYLSGVGQTAMEREMTDSGPWNASNMGEYLYR